MVLKELLVAPTSTSASSRVEVVYAGRRVVDASPLIPDQDWFWSERWQAMEAEADEDLREGRFKTFPTVDEFLESLDSDD